MNIFKRLFRVGKSEAHAAIDKLEDPVKMTEQVIREMKDKLGKANEALAQAKAGGNKLAASKQKFEAEAKNWEQKAGALDDKAQADPSRKEELEVLIVSALNNVENANLEASKFEAQLAKHKEMTDKFTKTVQSLNKDIREAETNIQSLRARAEVAKASKSVHKEMSSLENDSLASTLERMQRKVENDEFLADAYSGLEEDNKSDEDKIAEALGKDSPSENNDLLSKFRENRNA